MNRLKFRLKKGVVSLTAISLIMLMAAGCSNTKTETSNTTTTQTETSTQTEDTTTSKQGDSAANSGGATDTTEDNGISGEVTAVNGSEITISVNKGGGGAPKGDKPDGTAPDATTGSTTTDSTDNESDGQKPERTSEEKVITIDDESIIYVKDGDTETQGSLSDITVGKMIHITYTTDDSGNQVMEKITVQDMTQMPTGDKPSGDAQGSKEESTTTESTTETTE